MKVEIEVPKEVYEQAQLMARAQHISVGDLFASAFSDHLGSGEGLRNALLVAAGKRSSKCSMPSLISSQRNTISLIHLVNQRTNRPPTHWIGVIVERTLVVGW